MGNYIDKKRNTLMVHFHFEGINLHAEYKRWEKVGPRKSNHCKTFSIVSVPEYLRLNNAPVAITKL